MTTIRNLFLAALLALTFFATSRPTVANDPVPECNPCPWVR